MISTVVEVTKTISLDMERTLEEVRARRLWMLTKMLMTVEPRTTMSTAFMMTMTNLRMRIRNMVPALSATMIEDWGPIACVIVTVVTTPRIDLRITTS